MEIFKIGLLLLSYIESANSYCNYTEEPHFRHGEYSTLEWAYAGVDQCLYLCNSSKVCEVIWYKDDQPVDFDDNRIGSPDSKHETICISSIRSSDEGVYTCVVRNNMGSVNRSVSLRVYGGGESTSIEDHYRLHENLKLGNGGSNLLRPANDVRHEVEVGLRFAPVHVVLDEAKQILTIRGMLELKWTDFRLQWNPRDFSGINETRIPLKKSGDFTIWTPEVVLNESVETDFASFQPETFKARLEYTGVVRWYTLAVTKSLCRLNHRLYPFDRQTCYLTFTTWAYQVSEQLFYHIDDIFSNKKYKDYINDEGLWEIDIPPDTPECDTLHYDGFYGDGEEYSYVKYTIELRRKQRCLYFVSLIFPCLVLSVITMATPFLEHVTDADPAGFGLTCVLTLMVFLTLVFATLPSSSRPLISIFIAVFISCAGLLTICAILDYNVASKTDDSKTGQKNTSDTALAVTGVVVPDNRHENDPTSQGRTGQTTTPGTDPEIEGRGIDPEVRPDTVPTSHSRPDHATTQGTDPEIEGRGIDPEIRPDTDPTSQDRTGQTTPQGTDQEIAGRDADPERRPDTDPTSQGRTGQGSTSAAMEEDTDQANKMCGRCRNTLCKFWKGKSGFSKVCLVIVVLQGLFTFAVLITFICLAAR